MSEKIDDLPFPMARRTMAKAFRDDEGLRLTYVSNIAMLLRDRYGVTNSDEYKDAAKAILELVFEK